MVTDLGSEDLENLMLRLEQARWAAQSVSREPVGERGTEELAGWLHLPCGSAGALSNRYQCLTPHNQILATGAWRQG